MKTRDLTTKKINKKLVIGLIILATAITITTVSIIVLDANVSVNLDDTTTEPVVPPPWPGNYINYEKSEDSILLCQTGMVRGDIF